MSRRRVPLLAVLGLVFGQTIAAGQSTPGQTAPQQAEQPAQTAPSQEQREQAQRQYNEINARYAQAYYELARHELRRALEMNREISGSVSTVDLERLRATAQIAEQQLNRALGTRKAQNNSAQLQLTQAQAAAELARSRYDRALEANKRAPGTVNDLELERLRLMAEVGQLGLQRLEAERQLQNTQPINPLAELERLRTEVAQLRSQVAQLAKSIGQPSTQVLTGEKDADQPQGASPPAGQPKGPAAASGSPKR